MRFNNVIRRIWWIFAIDAAIFMINAFMVAQDASKLDAAGDAFHIYSVIAVTIAAFFVARYSGRTLTGIKVGGIFWLIWRPILFVVFGLLSIAAGSLDYKYGSMAALGYVFAQLLFSPIVFILCGCAGWLGSKLKRE